MVWLRMAGVAIRLAWPDLVTPWRSPLVRWRLETFGVQDAEGHLLHAEHVTPVHCLRFLLTHHAAILRFLRWAATL